MKPLGTVLLPVEAGRGAFSVVVAVVIISVCVGVLE